MEKKILKASCFFKKRKNLFKSLILPFLTDEEKINICSVDRAFHQNIKDHLIEKLLKLTQNLNLDITENDDRISKFIFNTIKNNTPFLVNKTRANYIQFQNNTNSYKYIALTTGEWWAHCDNPSYWEKKKLLNSTFGGETFYLRTVCWLDLVINFHAVKPGVYDVFLRQALESIYSMHNALSLKVLVETKDKAEDKIQNTQLFQSDFMSNEMIDSLLKNNKETTKEKFDTAKLKNIRVMFDKKTTENENIVLQDVYITTIDLTKFSESEFVKVKIAFFHQTGWWKSGWYIDAGILQKRE